MKFKLTESIIHHFEIEKEKVISILKDNISKKIQLFPDKLMHGNIIDNSLRAKINPSKGFVDPFKSILRGTVQNDFLTVKVIPSWTIITFLIVWCILIIIMAIEYSYNDLYESLKFIGFILAWTAFPFLLTKLKVHSDRKRFEKFLINKI